jgi:hypothetical protein
MVKEDIHSTTKSISLVGDKKKLEVFSRINCLMAYVT